MDIIHHYPPELTQLLIETLPRLIKYKKDVLNFFNGAGVSKSLYQDIAEAVASRSSAMNKFEIVRQILNRLNAKGEATLRERREILKRVTEWEDFSVCWENDRLEAKGLVAEVRRVVDVKDAFTRMKDERERERQATAAAHRAATEVRQRRRAELQEIRVALCALFVETDRVKRGKALEGVLNRLFRADGLSIREAFSVVGPAGEGVVEQIDGVVEMDGHLYLVEMKWWNEPLGVPEVSQHLIRIYHRNAARGVLISQSGFTSPAVAISREALQRCVSVLTKLEEVVLALEREYPFADLLREKVRAAIAEKNPLHHPLASP